MMPTGQPNRASCIVWMTLASSLHYFGYELARSAVFALLTSARHGFSSSWAVSLSTACVSPISVGLLSIYTHLYDTQGPKRTLLITALSFGFLLLLGGIVLPFCMVLEDGSQHFLPSALTNVVWIMPTRYFLFALFCLQNSFVFLLLTQHWSFLGSIVKNRTYTSWIAGVGSLVSTLAGLAVGFLGADLTTLLLVGAACLFLSSYCGNVSYEIAERHGFLIQPKLDKDSDNTRMHDPLISVVQRARQLFSRVPVLGWLCVEVFCYQCQSSLLNFLFVVAVKDVVTDDVDRAIYTANTFASINFCSGVLQFIVLPLLIWLKIDFTVMWVGLPAMLLGVATLMLTSSSWSLWIISMTFAAMKVNEYSLRHNLAESIYSYLDHESRFVGKEIIALFANRLGKSSVALILALVSLLSDASLSYIRASLPLLGLAWLVASIGLLRSIREQTKVKND